MIRGITALGTTNTIDYFIFFFSTVRITTELPKVWFGICPKYISRRPFKNWKCHGEISMDHTCLFSKSHRWLIVLRSGEMWEYVKNLRLCCAAQTLHESRFVVAGRRCWVELCTLTYTAEPTLHFQQLNLIWFLCQHPSLKIYHFCKLQPAVIQGITN